MNTISQTPRQREEQRGEKEERNVRKRDGGQKGIKRDIETKGELDR